MPTLLDEDIADFRSVVEVIKKLKLPALYRLIAQGRVPFIVQVGIAFMLSPRSIAFLKEYYPPDKRPGGMLGKANADKMRAEAAALDPACKARQKVWAKQYPNGEHNGRSKPMTKARKKSAVRS